MDKWIQFDSLWWQKKRITETNRLFLCLPFRTSIQAEEFFGADEFTHFSHLFYHLENKVVE